MSLPLPTVFGRLCEVCGTPLDPEAGPRRKVHPGRCEKLRADRYTYWSELVTRGATLSGLSRTEVRTLWESAYCCGWCGRAAGFSARYGVPRLVMVSPGPRYLLLVCRGCRRRITALLDELRQLSPETDLSTQLQVLARNLRLPEP